MNKPKNIKLLNWTELTPDLIEDMKDILKDAYSFTVRCGDPITLEFNSLSPKWEIKEEEELVEWTNMMSEKHPNFLLAPIRLGNNKIVCYISNSTNVLSIKKQ